jgi:hypothetical protein
MQDRCFEIASFKQSAKPITCILVHCAGLMMPCERKSVEPMAALTAPARVSAQHQILAAFHRRGAVGRTRRKETSGEFPFQGSLRAGLGVVTKRSHASGQCRDEKLHRGMSTLLSNVPNRRRSGIVWRLAVNIPSLSSQLNDGVRRGLPDICSFHFDRLETSQTHLSRVQRNL